MPTKKLKTTDVERVQRVIGLLRDLILDEHAEIPRAKGSAVVPVVMMTAPAGGDAPKAVMLADGRVMLLAHGRRQGIAGAISGCCAYAIDAAKALADFGVITQSECDTFMNWYLATSAAQNRDYEIRRIHDEAARYGYDLVKRVDTKR